MNKKPTKVKIRHRQGMYNLETKRMYLPIEVTATCPVCSLQVTQDLEQEYLSHPPVGESFDLEFSHETQNGLRHEFSVAVELQIRLRAAE